jgi:outer membrane immunogenic protein
MEGLFMRVLAVASLAASVLAAASIAARAADLPVRTQPAPVVYAPVSLWTGCYIGGNLGGSWASGDLSVTSSTGTALGSGNNSGFTGGGQIGCDYQTGAFVFGVRNMFDWSNRSSTRVIQNGAFTGYGATLKNNWVDLLTGRVGWVMQPQWLLYFQGGAAWRESTLQLFNQSAVNVGTSSGNRTGWTIGGGAEWRFAQNWSAFLEYNYADFGTTTAVFNTPALGGVTASAKSNTSLFLIGLNWRPSF